MIDLVITLLIVVVAWVALTIEAKRPGWGAVVREPTEFELAMERLRVEMQELSRVIGVAFEPAMRRATEGLAAWAAVCKKHGWVK